MHACVDTPQLHACTTNRDPFLNAQYVYEFVTGMQNGEDPNHLKVSSCCKHYGMLVTTFHPILYSQPCPQMHTVLNFGTVLIAITSTPLCRLKTSRIPTSLLLRFGC